MASRIPPLLKLPDIIFTVQNNQIISVRPVFMFDQSGALCDRIHIGLITVRKGGRPGLAGANGSIQEDLWQMK